MNSPSEGALGFSSEQITREVLSVLNDPIARADYERVDALLQLLCVCIPECWASAELELIVTLFSQINQYISDGLPSLFTQRDEPEPEVLPSFSCQSLVDCGGKGPEYTPNYIIPREWVRRFSVTLRDLAQVVFSTPVQLRVVSERKIASAALGRALVATASLFTVVLLRPSLEGESYYEVDGQMPLPLMESTSTPEMFSVYAHIVEGVLRAALSPGRDGRALDMNCILAALQEQQCYPIMRLFFILYRAHDAAQHVKELGYSGASGFSTWQRPPEWVEVVDCVIRCLSLSCTTHWASQNASVANACLAFAKTVAESCPPHYPDCLAHMVESYPTTEYLHEVILVFINPTIHTEKMNQAGPPGFSSDRDEVFQTANLLPQLSLSTNALSLGSLVSSLTVALVGLSTSARVADLKLRNSCLSLLCAAITAASARPLDGDHPLVFLLAWRCLTRIFFPIFGSPLVEPRLPFDDPSPLRVGLVARGPEGLVSDGIALQYCLFAWQLLMLSPATEFFDPHEAVVASSWPLLFTWIITLASANTELYPEDMDTQRVMAVDRQQRFLQLMEETRAGQVEATVPEELLGRTVRKEYQTISAVDALTPMCPPYSIVPSSNPPVCFQRQSVETLRVTCFDVLFSVVARFGPGALTPESQRETCRAALSLISDGHLEGLRLALLIAQSSPQLLIGETGFDLVPYVCSQALAAHSHEVRTTAFQLLACIAPVAGNSIIEWDNGRALTGFIDVLVQASGCSCDVNTTVSVLCLLAVLSPAAITRFCALGGLQAVCTLLLSAAISSPPLPTQDMICPSCTQVPTRACVGPLLVSLTELCTRSRAAHRSTTMWRGHIVPKDITIPLSTEFSCLLRTQLTVAPDSNRGIAVSIIDVLTWLFAQEDLHGGLVGADGEFVGPRRPRRATVTDYAANNSLCDVLRAADELDLRPKLVALYQRLSQGPETESILDQHDNTAPGQSTDPSMGVSGDGSDVASLCEQLTGTEQAVLLKMTYYQELVQGDSRYTTMQRCADEVIQPVAQDVEYMEQKIRIASELAEQLRAQQARLIEADHSHELSADLNFRSSLSATVLRVQSSSVHVSQFESQHGDAVNMTMALRKTRANLDSAYGQAQPAVSVSPKRQTWRIRYCGDGDAGTTRRGAVMDM